MLDMYTWKLLLVTVDDVISVHILSRMVSHGVNLEK